MRDRPGCSIFVLLREHVGFERLKQAVTRPLTGRRIGAYYGCLLLRPGKDMKLDDPEDPRILEDFLRALGAEPVPFAMRNECCGGYVTLETGLWQRPGRRQLWTMPRPRVRSCWLQLVRSASTI